jgi:polyisoprenoid-binding protein YceI
MKQWKRIVTSIAVTLILSGLTWAAEYTIDTSHSKALFKIKHLGISTVTGHFKTFSGSFEFDQKNIKASKVSATIEATSIDTDQERRDAHLRSADFFDVEKFPQITFVSKEIRDVKDGKFKVVGDLMMHGVTKSVVLDVELGGMVTMGGNERVAFTATTTLNRKDFGLTWNRAIESGGFVVGEDVQVLLEIEAIRKKETK